MFLLNHKQKLQSEQSECFINQLEVCIMGGSTKKWGCIEGLGRGSGDLARFHGRAGSMRGHVRTQQERFWGFPELGDTFMGP